MSLTVRPMTLEEVDIRIDYFHSASDEYLDMLGVDRSRLPSREDWRASYEQDFARPLEQREGFQIIWLLDDEPVGFSSADKITFGKQANVHLHVLNDDDRNAGMGSACVRMSVELYFDQLKLERLYCQPNAFNIPPNRALQTAGFKYVKTYEDRPSSMNTFQPITQWVIDRSDLKL